jgi:hypothetical protein
MELVSRFEELNFSFSMNWHIMLNMENNVDRESLKMMAEHCYRDIFDMMRVCRVMKTVGYFDLEIGLYLFPRNYDFVEELYEAFVERIEYYGFLTTNFSWKM